MKLLTKFALALALSTPLFTACEQRNFAPGVVIAPSKSDAAIALGQDMRKLWEDHITYTRNYIISAVNEPVLGDASAVAERLLKNQDDIGNAMKAFYGEEAGNKLSRLLRDHILIAGEVIAAAKAGKQADVDAAQTKWTANGKDIAALLSGANPSWPQHELERMLQIHLDLTTAEVIARLKGDWTGDIRAYDAGHEHMLMFADALTAGIVKQFPEKFR